MHSQIQEEIALKWLFCANYNKTTDLDLNILELLSLDLDQ